MSQLAIFSCSYKLGTAKLLPQLHEGHPLHEKVHGCRCFYFLHDTFFTLRWMKGFKQIMQIVVIVGFYIVKNLIGAEVRTQLSASKDSLCDDRLSSSTTDETRFDRAIDFTTFDRITLIIIKESNVWQLIGIIFLSLIIRSKTSSHIPSFSIKDDFRIDFVHSPTDHLHSFNIMDSHQVKAESVNIEFFYPVEKRINHIFTEHFMLTGSFVTDSCSILVGTVMVHSIVIIRNRCLEWHIHR